MVELAVSCLVVHWGVVVGLVRLSVTVTHVSWCVGRLVRLMVAIGRLVMAVAAVSVAGMAVARLMVAMAGVAVARLMVAMVMLMTV